MDETGLFCHALPDRGFGQKSKSCKGGKKSKQRLTIAFFVSASGKKEKPVVIWKSANPRCFRRFDKSLLPVTYFSQKKAWMTGYILAKLNRRMSSANRNILLFMDNAGSQKTCVESFQISRFASFQQTPRQPYNLWTWGSYRTSSSIIAGIS